MHPGSVSNASQLMHAATTTTGDDYRIGGRCTVRSGRCTFPRSIRRVAWPSGTVFTHCGELRGWAVAGQSYPHLLFQADPQPLGLALPLRSPPAKTFLALHQGLQNALWTLRGVPQILQERQYLGGHSRGETQVMPVSLTTITPPCWTTTASGPPATAGVRAMKTEWLSTGCTGSRTPSTRP